MTKKEMQKRTIFEGKQLPLKGFSWDSETSTFATKNVKITIDMHDIHDSTLRAGWRSTLRAGGRSTLTAGGDSTLTAGNDSTLTAGNDSTLRAGGRSTLRAGNDSTLRAGNDSTLTAGGDSTLISYYLSKNIAEGKNIVARRIDEPQVLILNNQTIQWCPHKIKGYIELINSKWYLNGNVNDNEYIIADGILSKVINRKGKVLKVINHKEEKESYIIQDGELYAHGTTIKEAKESLIYKISSRDTSAYDDYTLDTVVNRADAIKMYRIITGACESQTREFVERQEYKKEYTIQELINITRGQYNSDKFEKFFMKETK